MLLSEEISKIIDRDFEFPNTLVTITRTQASDDLYYGTVYVSIFGEAPDEALALLNKKIYNIQQKLNKRMRIRPVPKIHFEIDFDEVKRETVEKSLSELKRKGEI